MEQRVVINQSYYCTRTGGADVILVLNSGAYVLANYREQTGEVRWQRVIPASERKAIEEWLGQNFPSHHVPAEQGAAGEPGKAVKPRPARANRRNPAGRPARRRAAARPAAG